MIINFKILDILVFLLIFFLNTSLVEANTFLFDSKIGSNKEISKKVDKLGYMSQALISCGKYMKVKKKI